MTKQVRMTASGWETYTGPLCGHNFIDGVSEEGISRRDIDRIGAILQIELISPEGESLGQAGAAARLVNTGDMKADETAPMESPTSAETKEERTRDRLTNYAGSVKIYTEDELHEIVKKAGRTGLREVANHWNVKGKENGALIRDILRAQIKWGREQEIKRQADRVASNAAMAESLNKIAMRDGEIDAHARVLTPDETPNAIDADGKAIYVAPVKLQTADTEQPAAPITETPATPVTEAPAAGA